jgi:hypothetical protein
VTDHYACESSTKKKIPGLPIIKIMTDNSNGSYKADYTVSEAGSVSVSVELLKPGGVQAWYYNNHKFSGPPARFAIEPQISNDWGNSWNDLVTPTDRDYVSAIY